MENIYLFTDPEEDSEYVYLLMTDGEDHTLVKKFIYKSRKGRYIRVRTDDNRHRRVYLEEIEKYNGQIQSSNQGR